MINAHMARDLTLRSWADYIERLIQEAINEHRYHTYGVVGIPNKIKESLVREGYILEKGNDGHVFIRWEKAE